MGQPLTNPPVYFTLAQVRFNNVLKLADYLPDIQENMRRAGFPAFTRLATVALQFSVQQDGKPVPSAVPIEQYMFTNVEQTHSFLLTTDALTLQSTSYGTYEAFSETFLKGLAFVHEAVTLDFTDRVGLRYLDHIFPRQGETLESYLASEVHGMGVRLGGRLSHSFSETLCAFGDVQLLSRVVIQEGPVGFPPDITPQGLLVAERFAAAQGQHATLDTDGFVQKRQVFSLESVAQHLLEIHGVIGRAFKATVTEHALAAWE